MRGRVQKLVAVIVWKASLLRFSEVKYKLKGRNAIYRTVFQGLSLSTLSSCGSLFPHINLSMAEQDTDLNQIPSLRAQDSCRRGDRKILKD